MFEYMFSLVTDEFAVVSQGQELPPSKEQNKVEKVVRGKFLRDLEALRDNGYSLSPGSQIEITLQDILRIILMKSSVAGSLSFRKKLKRRRNKYEIFNSWLHR